jgi:hypothetical protein
MLGIQQCANLSQGSLEGGVYHSFGLFEPTVMFFGLCNSPATFQALMDHLFGDFIAEGWLIIYMDDLLIHSTGNAEHQERAEKVLQRLQDNHLYLKLEK